MRRDSECNMLCTKQLSRGDLKRARRLVRDGYVNEWILDNLPGASSFVSVDKTRKYYAAGFKLGYTTTGHASGRPQYYLNNHHTIVVRYRRAPGRAGDEGGHVVVGFEVYPKSIGPNNQRNEDGCPADLRHIEQNLELIIPRNKTVEVGPELAPATNGDEEDDEDVDDGAFLTVPYTYSIYFREDNSIEWNRRWDLYFVNQEEGSKIHWLAIVNSLIICALLSGIVFMIVSRMSNKGFKDASPEEGGLRVKRKPKAGPSSEEKPPGLLEQETEPDGVEDLEEDEALDLEATWKLVHADVFRNPANGYLLAPLVGSGMQLLFVAAGLILLSAFGILNPSFRGGFLSFGVGFFVFAGLFSGYYSARVYRTFGGQDWRRNTVLTAILFPGMLFSVVFILNLFVWAQASSTAIPFGTLVAIVFLWLCVQLPLVYVGSWYGYVKAGAWEHPTKTSAVPRQIPPQAWYIRGPRTILLAGLVPFAVIFIELLFVFQSVWQDKSGYYYVFGFMAVVSSILLLTVAEVTVVTIYVQLCSENYHWWWQSFLVGGGSAVWVFLYCVWYYFMKLHITGFVSSMLFFTYSFIACCMYGLLTGTVGFLTAYAFVRRMFG